MENNKIWVIFKDGLILFGVSTVLVVLADWAFSGLKEEVPKDDPIVAAISQGEIKNVEDAVIAAKKIDEDKAIIAVDEFGRTSLMRAAYANLANEDTLKEYDEKRATMCALLLDQGGSLDATDKDGWTALMWASWSGLPKVAETLLSRGAAVGNADRQGNTALTIAAQRGNADIVKSLLEKGADKNAQTSTNQTALNLAKSAMTEYPKKKDAYRETLKLLGGY